ncbi:MAG: hypothetical protein RL660_744 [Bacteroidota bacterium]|jgi:NAD-dependent deacetylase
MSKKRLVVLSGAGISAESGLKTFRDSDGLWNGYRIEDVATYDAFKRDPAMVLDFYNMRRRDVAAAKPNEAHKVLVALEQDFDVQIITQNIDDLHERAGSTKVLHLHGEIFKMKADSDDTHYYPIYDDINVGDCDKNGVQLRPHIVWFGEDVPLINTAVSLCEDADIFLVVGTSLAVYPAAGLVRCIPHTAQVYVVDKVIPELPPLRHVQAIEKTAQEGMKELQALLNEMK